MAETECLCSSVNVGSTKAGINMDAVKIMGEVIKQAAEATADKQSFGCATIVALCNAPEDNPFMAGAFHGVSELHCLLIVCVSGPGVCRAAVSRACKHLRSTDIAYIFHKPPLDIRRLR